MTKDEANASPKDAALRLALEALEVANSLVDGYYLPKEKAWMPEIEEAITAIKAALEAKDEPVAWMDASRFEELRNGFTVMTTLTKKKAFFDDIAIYTTPPQRNPLTDEEIGAILEGVNAYGTRLYTFARAIEAAHGIKE